MPTARVHIRASDADDTLLLRSLIRRAFKDVAVRFGLRPDNCPTHPSNCTREWIENGFIRGVRYFILEVSGTPVGCVALERATEETCYLERLSVLPGSRRKGYGRALVAHVINEAEKMEAGEISIGVIAGDTDLKAWYRRLGFIEKGTRQFTNLPFRVTFMTYALNP